MKRTFVRQISHEIRTPINILSMGLEVLKRDMRKSSVPERTKLAMIRELKNTCAMAQRTLDNVLLTERIEENILRLVTTEVPVYEFVEEAMRPFVIEVDHRA